MDTPSNLEGGREGGRREGEREGGREDGGKEKGRGEGGIWYKSSQKSRQRLCTTADCCIHDTQAYRHLPFVYQRQTITTPQ